MRDSGADEYLGKPFSKETLRNAIQAARKKQYMEQIRQWIACRFHTRSNNTADAGYAPVGGRQYDE
jgi:DNA-binding response OmpR family regulator